MRRTVRRTWLTWFAYSCLAVAVLIAMWSYEYWRVQATQPPTVHVPPTFNLTPEEP